MILVLHERSYEDGPIVFKGSVQNFVDVGQVLDLPNGKRCRIEGYKEEISTNGIETHCYIEYC